MPKWFKRILGILIKIILIFLYAFLLYNFIIDIYSGPMVFLIAFSATYVVDMFDKL